MKPSDAVLNLLSAEDMAKRESIIHSLNPLLKLLAVLCYITFVINTSRFDIPALTPFILFPAILWILSDLPFLPVARRILILLPFLFIMGILNPIFSTTHIPGHMLSAGWLVFISIICKGLLTVTALQLFILTTGIDGFAMALRMLHIPKIFVLQLLLTYRYLSLLASEAGRVSLAYSLRAPQARGVRFSAWGSLAGGILLRAFDRAGRIHNAMLVRGFRGEYRTGKLQRLKARDAFFLIISAIYFFLIRFFDIPRLLGGAF